MAKQSKRTRKFQQSGGVQGRLKKGTIIKKGKVKNLSKRQLGEDGVGPAKKKPMNNSYAEEIKQKREDADFLSSKNLGELDMDSFFASFGDDDAEVEDSDEEENNEMEDDSDDDDVQEDGDDNDDEEEEKEERDSESSDEKVKPTQGKKKVASSSDSDSDSEEDIEAAEKRMKQEMGKLKKKDPEFHQFLQENEESLLEYGADDNEEDDDDDDDEEDHLDLTTHDKRQENEQEDPDEEMQEEEGTMIRLTNALLEKLEKGTFKSHGVKALRKLVNAFKSACHLTDTEDNGGEKASGKKYHMESSDVFDRLMVISLTKLQDEFYYHLLGKGSTEKAALHKKKSEKASKKNVKEPETEAFVVEPNKPINPKLLEKSLRWVDIKPILSNFFKSVMHLLMEAKEPDLIDFVLKSLADFVPYMTPFPKIADSFLKTLTKLWNAPIDSSEYYQVVRLHSFLRIRQLAMTQPFPFIEQCLKKLYLAYAQRAKFATASSVTSGLPTLTFMGNCIVEIYSLDYHSSYQHAFVYIRQLALHLRTAIQKKTPEAFGAVYCWQYLHCLKLWVAVLTAACQPDDDVEEGDGGGAAGEEQLLRSLLFPLSQVILGTVRLIPSTRYLPLRLHCVRLLQQLAAASEIFLPTTSILLDAFDLRELYQAPKKVTKGAAQPLALTFRLRADNPLRTMEEQEMCIAEVFVLLNREVDLYQYSAGFPEFSVQICQRLRKFCKETRQARWRAYARGCLDLCDKYSKRAVLERSTQLTDVAPINVKQFEVLKPMGTPRMSQRYQQAIEKEKRLEVASRPLQKTKNTKASSKEEQEVDDDGDVEANNNKSSSPSKKRKRNKKKRQYDKFDGPVDENALEQQDEVQEGIHWSDDDDDE